MLLRWSFAALHLIALGIGLGAVWARARGFRGRLDADGLRRVFAADAWWGIAFGLWLATGLVRLLTGLEKSTGYYMRSDSFWVKMALLGLILALETWPMSTLIRWRIRLGRGETVDTSSAATFATISTVQALLVVAMVFDAIAMARGIGF